MEDIFNAEKTYVFHGVIVECIVPGSIYKNADDINKVYLED